jgi:hypothetical protein
MTSEEQAAMLCDLPPNREGWLFTGRKTVFHPLVGHVETGKDGWEKRRIPYLAAERNKVMEPFYEARDSKWDKILWINDVVFNVCLSPRSRNSKLTNGQTDDVLTLLSTRSGDYAAACSLDFNKSPTRYYDTFALRDADGSRTTSLAWPYFFAAASRHAVRAHRPVPVQSCWNGMVAFAAAPFYLQEQRGARLRFRGVDDGLAGKHVEGSECCFIHADSRAAGGAKGVWVNPNVRVAYASVDASVDAVYRAVNPEVGVGRWPGGWEAVSGVWGNRWVRWTGRLALWGEVRMVRKRVEKWVEEERVEGREVEEKGLECLVNEMQVLFNNGWQHV